MIRSSMKVIWLCFVVVFVVSALTATAAQASGPLWITGSPATSLKAGETRAIISKSEEKFVFRASGGNIECEKVTNVGFILGGNPGTDYTEIKFEKCFLEASNKECLALGVKPLKSINPAEVIVDAKTVLVYPEGVRTSALDAFAPQGESANPNLYVEFELLPTKAGGCKAITAGTKVKVTAEGTEIVVKGEKRKCGVLAEVGEANAKSEFVLAISGATNKIGLLRFPEPALTKAELWNGTAFEKIECKLSAGTFGTKPIERGVSQVEITAPVAGEPFGWDEV
jgi:hypothetical protein